MWQTQRLKNIQVPRYVVAELMREMDLEGCEQRKAKSPKRKSYFSSGPNYTWHVDGYDKLKPYRFPIHGRIDGWSRKKKGAKLCSQCYAAQHSYVPLLSLRRDSPS